MVPTVKLLTSSRKISILTATIPTRDHCSALILTDTGTTWFKKGGGGTPAYYGDILDPTMFFIQNYKNIALLDHFPSFRWNLWLISFVASGGWPQVNVVECSKKIFDSRKCFGLQPSYIMASSGWQIMSAQLYPPPNWAISSIKISLYSKFWTHPAIKIGKKYWYCHFSLVFGLYFSYILYILENQSYSLL